MPVLAPAAAYFGVVFATGFVLGAIRVTLVVPAIGVRAAELLELPFMMTASWLAAGWLVRRFAIALPGHAARVGRVAFVLLLGAEVCLGVVLRGVGPVEVLLDKDPVSGPAYYASVCMFGMMPWLLTRRSRRSA